MATPALVSPSRTATFGRFPSSTVALVLALAIIAAIFFAVSGSAQGN